MTNGNEGHYKKWTDDDDDFLKKRFHSERLADIARQVGLQQDDRHTTRPVLGLWKA